MSMTTTITVGVNILTQAITYQCNTLLQMGYLIEHGRVQGGHHMVDYQEVFERGLMAWLTEQKLERVHFELYSPQSNTAYERCEVEISYLADPREEVVKPPIAQLEELFTRLEKLPADAQFRLVVSTAPGASAVPGWAPTTLRDFSGGVKETHAVGGEGHGYGPISGRTSYIVANWNGQVDKPPATDDRLTDGR